MWSRKELLPQTAYAADIGPRILSHYEDLFGEPFPLPKQDLVAVPDFAAGAMENWGLVVFRENALLYEEIRGIFEGFVRASVQAIEQRDPTTSGHSMRVGAAQDLLTRGFDTAAIMRAGGWKSVTTLARYLEKAEHNVWA